MERQKEKGTLCPFPQARIDDSFYLKSEASYGVLSLFISRGNKLHPY